MKKCLAFKYNSRMPVHRYGHRRREKEYQLEEDSDWSMFQTSKCPEAETLQMVRGVGRVKNW